MALEAGPFLNNFFRISDFFFRKIVKNYDTSEKIKNHLTTTYILIYVFSRKFKLRKIIKKNHFPNFCSFLKSPWDSGDGDGDGDCDSHGEF